MHQRFTVAGPAGRSLPTDTITYGPDIASEDDVKLLGTVEGRRILDLGCGAGRNAIALARRGAKVIAIDEDPAQLADAREGCDQEDVRVEMHQGPLAELAFIRADTVDAALSVFGLATVDDVDRVFRQVHRVLRPEAPLVLALPHPASAMVDTDGDAVVVTRSYWDVSPIPHGEGGGAADVPRTISQLFTSLQRANFRVDTVLEPEPHRTGPRGPHWSDTMRYVPATLLVRARKQGL